MKPPRLKKLARLQKLQEQERELNIKRSRSEENMMLHHKARPSPPTRSTSRERPEISAPVLLATTLNPNDAEGHKTISGFAMRKSSSVSEVTAMTSTASSSQKQQQSPSPSSSSDNRLSFKDLKRLTSFFPSLSSLHSPIKDSLANPLNKSSFYVAEAIYEDANNHIYEEIPESNKAEDNSSSQQQRPLPPIPEQQQQPHKKSAACKKRGRSIFEGASKYEILHYLRDAKDRIGHGDFEIDLEPAAETGFVGMQRNHTHRVSAISTASDSSSCSVESSDSSSGGGGSVILRDPIERILGTAIEIERTDSGVGSEAG